MNIEKDTLIWSQALRLMWRWSLASTVAIGLFWLCWYWSTGEIPKEHLVRWADVGIGPIWSVSGVLLIKLTIGMNDWFDDFFIPFGLFASWALGLVAALTMGIVTGLMVSGIILGIVLTLLIGSFTLMLLVWLLSLLPPVRWTASWLAGS